jgi:predicted phosphohydrolase
MPKFQLISDIHLEKNPFTNYYHKILAPNLLLCGDIGSPFLKNYKNFLNHCSYSHKRVFIITGNHEYWKSSISETNDKINDLVKSFDNIFFLNNKTYLLFENNKYYKIFGSTLWSYIHPTIFPQISKISTDNKLITNFSTQIRNKFFMDSINIITKNTFDIIMTHHMPSFLLIDHQKYSDQKLIWPLYASDCDLIMKNTKFWVYGHTHTPSSKIINFTQTHTNPYNKIPLTFDLY